MDDARIWEFEEELWRGGADVYREKVDPKCLMALPAEPFIYDGEAAIAAVEHTPRWEQVSFSEQRVARPQEGLIVIAYQVEAARGDKSYRAACSSTLRRLSHEHWTVVQHQQTPLGIVVGDP
jgi:hypothetical protein